MKRNGLVLMTAVVFLLTACAFVFADEIKIGAGAAPSSGVLNPIKVHFEKATGVKLSLVEQGPKAALQDLMKGSLDAAGSGLTLDEWIALMKKEGIEINRSEVQAFVIGKSRAVAMINKANPVSALTKDQLIGIFTGKISNWKEVGGKDMPIIIVWGKLTPGMNSLYVNKVLDKAPVSKDVLEATTGNEVKQNINSNPEAIGISASSVADDTVKVPGQPDASSVITLVTKGAPSQNIQKLLDYIKGDGRKYIK